MVQQTSKYSRQQAFHHAEEQGEKGAATTLFPDPGMGGLTFSRFLKLMENLLRFANNVILSFVIIRVGCRFLFQNSKATLGDPQ